MKMKFNNWEYWPWYMFYLPNIPYAIYLALKARNLIFFSIANPAIRHSGNGTESKFATLQLISNKYTPSSIFVKANEKVTFILKKVNKFGINYPLIVKPDIGFRGLLVKKISSEKELIAYLEKYGDINLIIQEYIDFKNECGILFYRLPNTSEIIISSITLKKYLTVTGDGKSNLKQLILADKRAKKYIDLLTDIHENNFDLILDKGIEKVLNHIGNHSKGTRFINGNHLINSELTNSLSSVLNEIPNLFYGRLDIKYDSFEKLKKGNSFKIIEINGIISEPTHIYDPEKITYFGALKELRKHWKIIYRIARLNHHFYGIKYEPVSTFVKSLLRLKKYTKLIKHKSLSV